MNRLAKRRAPKKKSKVGKYIMFGIFGAVAILVLYFIFRPTVWDGKSRLSIATYEAGEVKIVTLDPESGSLTTINIPGNTQVSAAYNMGTYQIKNIWDLGKNEKKGGRFLATSIMKSFHFPIEAWEGEGDTNLTLKDKINIEIYKTKVKNSSRISLDLDQTSYITKAKLVDGSDGFVIREGLPPVKLLTIFADSRISKTSTGLAIIDKTDRQVSSNVVGILEVLGLKVTSIDMEDEEDLDCIVNGGEDTGDKIARLFGCSRGSKKGSLEIILGTKFSDRF